MRQQQRGGGRRIISSDNAANDMHRRLAALQPQRGVAWRHQKISKSGVSMVT